MNKRGSILISFLKLIIFLVFLAIVLKVSINYAEIALREYFNRTEVEVPKFTSLSLKDANKLAKKLNLNIEIIRKQHDSNVEKNHIISQSPIPGEFVKCGRIIELIVSKGANKKLCPSLRNKNISEVPFILQSSGFKLGNKSYIYSDEIKKDCVVTQYPSGDSMVPAETPVNVLISLGKSKHPIIVPKLVGFRVEAARIALEKLGLRLGSVGYRSKSDVENFVVLTQEPSEYSKVAPGTRINLIVNRKNNGSSTDIGQKVEIVKFVVPPGTGPREVKMWLQDETGTREIYRNTHYPTEEIDVTVSGVGKMKVLIYLDNTFYNEINLN